MHAVEIANLTKRYGATVALDDVSFSIGSGEVRALIGENGAGKSTIVKILSGLVAPDSGSFSIFGRAIATASPKTSHKLGVQTAFQEMTLVPHLTVAENLLIPYQPIRFGVVSNRLTCQKAEEALAALGLSFIDPQSLTTDLDLATRQKIEIAKAISRDPKLLLLDEPTSALSADDVDWLHEIVERLSAKGVTVAFVSHRMEEVRRFCSSMTLLRNGRHVGTFAATDVSDEEVVEHVIGRSLGTIFPAWIDCRASSATPPLAAQRVSTGSKVREVSFTLRAGEVLGLAALQGMGQFDLFRALFGDAPVSSGTIEIDGRAVRLSSPRDAIANGIDMGLIPEDRAREGLLLERPARETASMPSIGSLSHWGHLNRTHERALVDAAFARLNVPPRADFLPGKAFSGGNQQKIVMSKWLVAGSRILLMFDPTRGVDIGAKHQIYMLIREFAAEGRSVLLYSTETAELVHLCDRVLVMYEGRIALELDREQLSENRIVSAAMGNRERTPTTASSAWKS
ncbi:sugar ABC transporter ATP-binding protein [Mesorhizobium shangrilense]|uniref:Sugar ABC transporter ATP-binding protein n=1 Tax=Mesorhizobium shangrilense TaxID=460060 RepID=A0ABV2DGN2_9HYPH